MAHTKTFNEFPENLNRKSVPMIKDIQPHSPAPEVRRHARGRWIIDSKRFRVHWRARKLKIKRLSHFLFPAHKSPRTKKIKYHERRNEGEVAHTRTQTQTIVPSQKKTRFPLRATETERQRRKILSDRRGHRERRSNRAWDQRGVKGGRPLVSYAQRIYHGWFSLRLCLPSSAQASKNLFARACVCASRSRGNISL